MNAITLLLVATAVIAPVPISLLVERLRKRPGPPASLAWAPDIPIDHIDLDGIRVRYIRTGGGPPLVLLHTLRTQLDIFHKVVPELAADFTVYALDYPGHGWSDIPAVDYKPEVFTNTVSRFLEATGIEDAIIAGVSIGGTIPLLIAADHNPRVLGVVAINPYDYGRGGGIRRANLVARIVFTLASVPILGETVMRMRNDLIERKILEGGVASANALTPQFLHEMAAVGNRPGHYRAFLNLLRHADEWERAHGVYPRISLPVLLLYGDQDWSTETERGATLNGIPKATLVTVPDGGHFLPLDQPEAVVESIRAFRATAARQTRS